MHIKTSSSSMTTISPNRKKLQDRSRFLVWGIIFLLVFGAVVLLRAPLAGMFWMLAEPVSKFQTASMTSLGVFFSSFSSNRSLAEENARLRTELKSAEATLLDRTVLAAENQDLKTRLGRPYNELPRTLAVVIARPPALPYDTLMLDIGESAGLKIGDLVSAGGSAYIGSITEVYGGSSRVTLFSSAGESSEAQLLTKVGTSTIAFSVKGQGGGSLVGEVPVGVVVHVGDKVLLPNIAPQLIALVSYVEEKSDTSFKKVFMQLPVNIYTLRFVEVYHTPQ